MKRTELEHVIRAAWAITDEYEIVVVGSQSILATAPHATGTLVLSQEADVFPLNRPELADLIDGSIGEDSPFHGRFGYYAQGVSPSRSILPNGWRVVRHARAAIDVTPQPGQTRLIAYDREQARSVAAAPTQSRSRGIDRQGLIIDDPIDRFALEQAEWARRAQLATGAGAAAYERLLTLAERHDSGQAGRVARLLAGLFNGQDFPIDPYELRALDVAISDDVLACLDALRWGKQDVHTLVPYGERRTLASLTVCTPGSTTQCNTIDHILVDTASTGLRVLSTALTAAGISAAQYSAANGDPYAQCLGFVDGNVWGRLRSLDVVLGGHRLSSLLVQVIGDEQGAALPPDCSGPLQNDVASFCANDVLGISTFLQDCGAVCATFDSVSLYYRCPPSGCVKATIAVTDQLQNPISLLPADNNGLVITLPDVPDSGAIRATGALIMGLNTRSNNQVGVEAAIFPLDPQTGNLSVSYKGTVLPNSFFDTGSNFLFFNDPTLPRCTAAGYSRYYCPVQSTTISPALRTASGQTRTIELILADAYARYVGNPTSSAFRGMGASNTVSGSFDFGIPFYLGRTVLTAFEASSSPNRVAGVDGPWVAF